VRHDKFKDAISQEIGVMFYNNVSSVMDVLVHETIPNQWRLVIDSSKVSLKMVLLYNGKKISSVPVTHAANMKVSYESMQLLLGKIKYDEFKWKLCGDLTVVALLLGMQLGYTKYCCFLCEWDSRDKKNHYISKLWPKRSSLERFLVILSVRVSSIHCNSALNSLTVSNRHHLSSVSFWVGDDSGFVYLQKQLDEFGSV
jgi:hypothetical protein